MKFAKKVALMSAIVLLVPAVVSCGGAPVISPPPVSQEPANKDPLEEAITIAATTATQTQPVAAAPTPAAPPPPAPRPALAAAAPETNALLSACPGFGGTNIRSAASANSAIVFTAVCNQRIMVTGAAVNGWYPVLLNPGNVRGWVVAENLKLD